LGNTVESGKEHNQHDGVFYFWGSCLSDVFHVKWRCGHNLLLFQSWPEKNITLRGRQNLSDWSYRYRNCIKTSKHT